MAPETRLPLARPPAAIDHRIPATRFIVLSLLTSLLLSALAYTMAACTIAHDDTPDFKLSNQSPPDHPSNASPQQIDPDFISLPPTHQEFSSPDGKYVFVLSAVDNWTSKQAIGELFEGGEGGRQSLWTSSLPHEYGPRYVLVSSQGQVLLLDEWINVASRQAVMLLSRENVLLGQHSFDAIQKILAVPRASIVAMAQSGWWIASPPTLNESGETVRVETAGKVLVIDLTNGELSVEGSE